MKNQKGFSMVELLAVIVILGIISVVTIGSVTKLVEKAKKNQLEQQEKAVRLAAESYAQANRKYLPKTIGTKKTIQLQELLTTKYITEPIKDSAGNSCMQNSYIEVYKSAKNKYVYTPYLICGNASNNGSVSEITQPKGEISMVPSNHMVQISLDAGNTTSGTARSFQSYTVTIKNKSTGAILYQTSKESADEKEIKLSISTTQMNPTPSSLEEVEVSVNAITTTGENVNIKQ